MQQLLVQQHPCQCCCPATSTRVGFKGPHCSCCATLTHCDCYSSLCKPLPLLLCPSALLSACCPAPSHATAGAHAPLTSLCQLLPTAGSHLPRHTPAPSRQVLPLPCSLSTARCCPPPPSSLQQLPSPPAAAVAVAAAAAGLSPSLAADVQQLLEVGAQQVPSPPPAAAAAAGMSPSLAAEVQQLYWKSGPSKSTGNWSRGSGYSSCVLPARYLFSRRVVE